jgi:glycosyltransferase involved in cell wall biosynthesis
LPLDRTLVAFTGRLLKGKGLDVLIPAFARLAATNPQLHLVILGSGAGHTLSVEEEVRASVRDLRLDDRVTLTGRVENVEEYLRAADIFAFPSIYEGLPHSIVEAAAAGLPSAASRAGGIPDVVEDGENGILVEPGNIDALEAALGTLGHDAALRERLGRRARAIACERFSLATVSARYRQLFDELARRPA